MMLKEMNKLIAEGKVSITSIFEPVILN
jgi:hypothetical protein